MSWTEAFGLYGVDVSTPGVSDYARGAIASFGVGQGWSANRILAEFKDAGVGIQRSQGLELVGAERERQGAALTSAQLGVDYSTGELVGPEPPSNWTGQYVHQVTMTYREQVGSNQYELHTRTVGIKTSTPLTPSQAINAAFDVMTPAEGEEGSPDMPDMSQVIMSQLSGIWYDTQGRALPGAGPGVV